MNALHLLPTHRLARTYRPYLCTLGYIYNRKYETSVAVENGNIDFKTFNFENAMEELQHIKLIPSLESRQFECQKLLKKLIFSGNSADAIKLFKRINTENLTLDTCNTVVRYLSRFNNIKHIEAIVNEMKKLNMPIEVDVVNVLLKSYAMANDSEKLTSALNLVEKIKADDQTALIVTKYTLINLGTDVVFKVFKGFDNHVLTPELYNYFLSEVSNKISTKEEFMEILGCVQKSRRDNIELEKATYEKIIGAIQRTYGTNETLSVCSALFQNCSEQTKSIAAACVIGLHYKLGEFEKAWQMFQSLPINMRHPEVYETVLYSLFSRKKIRFGTNLLSEMVINHVPITCRMIKNIMKCYVKCDMMQEAINLYDIAPDRYKVEVNTPELNTYYLSLLLKIGNEDMAGKFFNKYLNKDIDGFSIMAEHAFQKEQFQNVIFYFEGLINSDKRAPRNVSLMCLKSFLALGDDQGAEKLFTYINNSYSRKIDYAASTIMLEYYIKGGKKRRVKSLISEILQGNPKLEPRLAKLVSQYSK
ncbi:hypothetical protein AKO1_006543 [Acrasis kona]|uniref:Pentatricopeptide repeat-containing protein n=1 Tax=Acrasis kona TaxID=1008807 RepID=A0AAW2ZJF7_9EUKA